MPTTTISITRHSPEGALWERLTHDPTEVAEGLERWASSLEEFHAMVGAIGQATLFGIDEVYLADGSTARFSRTGD